MVEVTKDSRTRIILSIIKWAYSLLNKNFLNTTQQTKTMEKWL